MSSIIGGEGLGLFNTSLNQLNGFGARRGTATGIDGVYINAVTGNVVLRAQDELLVGQGLDVATIRTYNSQGLMDDVGGDNWRLNFERRLENLPVGSGTGAITRVSGDGHRAPFTHNGSLWIATDGDGAHDTIEKVGVTWIWRDGSSRVTETYDAAGRLIAATDANGNEVTYTYSGNDLIRVTDESGQITHLDYSGGQLVGIRTETDSVQTTRVRYSYDGQGRLSTVTVDLTPGDNSIADHNVLKTVYTYDGSSRRITGIQQQAYDGSSFVTTASATLGYTNVSGTWRITSLLDGLGRLTQFSYDTGSRHTDVTDPQGNVTRYVYDSSNRLIRYSTVSGGSEVAALVQYGYDSDDNVTSVTDALGRVTSYTYNDGLLTQARDDAGNTVDYVWNANKQLQTVTEWRVPDTGSGPSQAKTSRLIYDSDNNLRFEISPEGYVTEHRYHANGNRTGSLRYTVDAYSLGGLTSSQVPTEGQLQTWAGGADGSAVERIDYAYDFRGQLSATTAYTSTNSSAVGIADGTQSVTSYIYDARGLLLETVNARANGEVGDFVTSFVYDGAGRLISTTDSENRTTATDYDDAGLQLTVTSAHGLVTTTTVNSAGQILSVAYSDGSPLGTTTYAYDDNGNLRRVTDPTGRQAHFLYDELDRVVAEIDPEGRLTETVYDDAGQVIRALVYAVAVNTALLNDGSGNPANIGIASVRPSSLGALVTRHVYDDAGRKVYVIDGQGYVTQSFYDGQGQLTDVMAYATAITLGSLPATPTASQVAGLISTHADDRHSRWFYDDSSRLQGQLDAGGHVIGYQYDNGGRLTEVTRYAGQVTNGTTHATGSLAALKSAVGTGGDDQHAYYLYDGQGRQIAEVDAEGYLTEWQHDHAGNVTGQIRYRETVSYSGQSLSALRPGSPVDPQAQTWRYDELHRVVSHTDIHGIETETAYTTQGTVHTITRDVGGDERVVTYSHDALGRVLGALGGRGSDALAANPGSSSAIWTQWATQHEYDAAGRRTATIAPGGDRTLFYYDDAGRLTHTITAEGEVKETQYTILGQAGMAIEYAARLTPLQLATLNGGLVNGTLSTLLSGMVSNPDNRIIELQYNLRGLLEKVIDARGFATESSYNAWGDVIQQIRDTGPTGSGTRTDEFVYDQRSQRTQSTVDAGGLALVTETRYDAFGRVIETEDALQRITEYEYDRLGRQITITDPTSASFSTTWDAFSRVLTQTDALSRTTTFAYDENTRTVIVTGPDDSETTTLRNAHGEVVSITDGNGDTTVYEYDADGNLVRATDDEGNITETVFDARGRVTAIVRDTAGLRVGSAFEYDATGRQIALREGVHFNLVSSAWVIDTVARTTAISYNAFGQRTQQVVDPGSGKLNLTTSWTYDTTGNVLARADANGHITRYAWDAQGQLVYEVDPLGNVLSHGYDAAGRIVQQTRHATALSSPAAATSVSAIAGALSTHADDQTTRRVHDAAGQLRFVIDGLGQVTETRYNDAGRAIWQIRYGDAINLGSLSSAPTVSDLQTLVGALELAEDRTARSVYDAGGQLRYSIDALGHVTETRYDSMGRIDKTIAWQTSLNLAGLSADPSASTIAGLLPGSPGGTDRVTTYSYDDVGRLTQVLDAEGYTETYTYDGIGNRLTYTNANGHTWTYTYDGAGRMVSETTPQVTVTTLTNPDDPYPVTVQRSLVSQMGYDSLGNVTQRTEDALGGAPRTTEYAYDAAGRQTQVIHPQVGIYDSGEEDEDHPALRAESMERPTSTTVYDAFGNGVAGQEVGGTWRYKAYDAANRLQYEVDAKGYVTGYSYDAFGNRLSLTRYAKALDLDGHTDGTALSVAQIEMQLDPGSEDRTLHFEYDRLNRQSAVIEPEVWAYHAGADQSFLANPKTTFTYNAFGEVIRQSSLDNASTSSWLHTRFYYSVRGDRIAQIDAAGYLTQWEYDAAGQATRQIEWTDALSSGYSDTGFTAPVYVAPNYSVPTYDTDYREMRYTYDKLGRILSEKRVGVTHSHMVSGNTVQKVADLTSTVAHDGVGNVTVSTDAAGSVTNLVYDALGRQIAEIGPQRDYGLHYYYDIKRSLTTWNYDAFGNQVIEIQHADGGWIDGSGNWGISQVASWLEDPMDPYSPYYEAPGQLQVYNAFDGFHNLYWETNPFGYDRGMEWLIADESAYLLAQYPYNILGTAQGTRFYSRDDLPVFRTQLFLSYPNHNYYYYNIQFGALNGLGDLSETMSIDQDGKVYVGGSHVTSIYLGNYYNFEIAYNDQDEVVYRIWELGDDPSNGFETSIAQTGSSEVNWGIFANIPGNPGFYYDVVLQLYSISEYLANPRGGYISQPNGKAQYSFYDALGRVVSSVDASGNRADYSYDARGNMVKVWQTVEREDESTWSFVQVFEYDDNGRQTATKTLENEAWITQEVQYNAFGEIIARGVNNVFHEQISYDNNGRIWRSNSNGGVTTVHLHDLQGRVTAEIVSPDLNLAAGAYADAADVDDLTTGVRRTEMVYDALGYVTSHRLPGFTQDIGMGINPVFSLTGILSATGPNYLSWENTAPLGADVVMRMRRVGEVSWSTATVVPLSRADYTGLSFQAGFGINVAGMDEGIYEYELEYKWPGATHPLSSSSGQVQIYGRTTVRPDPDELTAVIGIYGWEPALIITAANGYDLSGIQAIEIIDTTGRGASLVVPVIHDGFGNLILHRIDLLPGKLLIYDYETHYIDIHYRLIGSETGQVHSFENTEGYYLRTGSPAQAVFMHLMQGAVSPEDIPPEIYRANLSYRIAGTDSEFHSTSIHSMVQNGCENLSIDDATALNALPQQYEFFAEFYDEYGSEVDLSLFAAQGGTVDGKLTGIYDARFGVVVGQNPHALPTQSVNPTITRSFDRWGQALTQTSAMGDTTTYVYDAFGHMVKQTLPQVDVVSETGIITQEQPETLYAYDLLGRMIQVEDANGNRRKFVYNQAGELVRETDALANSTHYSYDMLGRQIGQLDALSRATYYSYDGMDRLVSQTKGARRFEYRYDALGNLLNDDGIKYDYDSRGNVITHTSRAGYEIDYTYDQYGNRTSETNGNLHTLSWISDAFGKLLTSTDYVGLDTDFTYNSAGQLTREAREHYYQGIYASPYDGSAVVQTVLGVAVKDHEYYENGLKKSVLDSGGIFTSSTGGFLMFGRGLTEYRYNAAGQVTRERFSSGMGQGSFGGGGSAYFGVDPELQQMSLGSFYAPYTLQDTELSYDAHGRLTHSRGLTASIQYDYDAVGNRRSTQATYRDKVGTDRTMHYSYRYDANNRVVKSLHANVTGFTSSNSGTFSGLGGQFITYDAVGNRIGAKAFEGLQTATSISASHRRVADLLYTHFVTHGSVTNEEQRYLYDDQNRLTRVETPMAVAISTRAYDAYGNVIEYRDWVSKDRQAMTYDGDGRLLTQDNYVNHSTLQSQIRYNLAGTYTGTITGNNWERLFDNGQIADANLPSYDKAGNLIHFTVYVPGTNAYTHHYVYEYKRGDSYLETRQVVTVQLHYTGQSPGGTGATQTQYDAWGNTALVVGNFASGGGYRGFLYNHNGQVVMQYRATNQEVQTYHYAGTTPLGSHTDHLDADFDYNYTPISDVYPDRTAGSYTVQKNDTLQAIALKVWGDASLWYVIADANGIRSNSDLYAGRQLKLPNQVTNAHNTNETYRPYNAGEIIGSTTPKAPEPPPAVVPPRSGGKRGGCGFIAQIIMIVVIVIVTIYTAGAAAAVFAPAASAGMGTMAAGAAALGGSLGVGGIAAAAVGGALGSIAGQLVGKAMGVVDHFSWKAVALAGLSSAVTAGIGYGVGKIAEGASVIGQGSKMMGAVTRGALAGATGSAVNQGLNIWLGDQESFSWGGVAAGAIVGGISAGAGYDANNGTANIVGQEFDPLKVVGDTLKQTAVDYSRQYISMAIDGKGKPDFAKILGDSFGNALGNAIVGHAIWSGGQSVIQSPSIRAMEEADFDFGLSEKAVGEIVAGAINLDIGVERGEFKGIGVEVAAAGHFRFDFNEAAAMAHAQNADRIISESQRQLTDNLFSRDPQRKILDYSAAVEEVRQRLLGVDSKYGIVNADMILNSWKEHNGSLSIDGGRPRSIRGAFVAPPLRGFEFEETVIVLQSWESNASAMFVGTRGVGLSDIPTLDPTRHLPPSSSAAIKSAGIGSRIAGAEFFRQYGIESNRRLPEYQFDIFVNRETGARVVSGHKLTPTLDLQTQRLKITPVPLYMEDVSNILNYSSAR